MGESDDLSPTQRPVRQPLLASFQRERRFPERVFTCGSGRVVFFEFARAFSDGAYSLFSRLATANSDEHIWLRVMEPDADAYYRQRFGMPGEIALPAQGAADDYVARTHTWPRESIPDAIAYRGDVVVWGGPSAGWCCWGERAPNLCALLVPKHESVAYESIVRTAEQLPILTLEEALQDIVSSEFHCVAEFERFSDAMRRDYSS